jgi:two-component system phosphate regulon sensor histidine kinase PhoR
MLRRLSLPLILVLTVVLLAAVVATPWTDPDCGRAALLGAVAGAAAVGAVAVLVFAAWRVQWLRRPLRELTDAVDRMAASDGGHHVDVASRDDLGRLGRSFNRMSDRLADRITRLEQERQQLRAILSGMVEGVVALDGEQRVLYANGRAAALLEFHINPPIGRYLWEVVRQRPFLDVVHRALADVEPHREELPWQGLAVRSLAVHVAHLPGRPPRGAVLVIHDTSELRRLERLRQEFVANVSHELKTPLSVIKACVETLLDGAMDDRVHRGPFLNQISAQTDRLHMLILDLISLGRIESGEHPLEFQDVAVDDVVNACLERHRARAESRGQALIVSTENEIALTAWTDEDALEHILDNLLDNAVKYTPPGGQICVGWNAEDDDVCLEVRDTGIGIPEADLPRIFERFYRVDKARSRELGGTGLGLAIVKHLTQALQGSVRASSKFGQGTTFTVRLPRVAPSPTLRGSPVPREASTP